MMTAITSRLTLRCDKCKREQGYDRGVDPSIPAAVATIVFSRCDRCDSGDFGTEWWLDASGQEISQYDAPPLPDTGWQA